MFFVSGILNEKFMPHDKRNLEKFSKYHFTCPENHFSCQKNLQKHNNLFFAYLQQKRSCENFWQTCQKFSCNVHSNILRKTSFLKVSFFLSEILSVSFIPHGKTSSARLSKFQLACPQKFFGRNWIYWNFQCIFIIRPLWANSSEPFREKKAGRVVKTEF